MKWVVDYALIESVVVEAESEDEAIEKAMLMPNDKFEMAGSMWEAYVWSITNDSQRV